MEAYNFNIVIWSLFGYIDPPYLKVNSWDEQTNAKIKSAKVRREHLIYPFS